MSEEGCDRSFCTHCGAKLTEDASYCPECGSPVPGVRSNPYTGSAPCGDTGAYEVQRADDRLIWIVVLVGIYAALSLISGLFTATESPMLIQYMKEAMTPEQWQTMLDSLMMTEDQLLAYMVGSGYASVASGALAACAVALCAIRRYWLVAVLFCAAASFAVLTALAFAPPVAMGGTALSSGVLVVIGLMMSFIIYRSKPAFRD